MKPTDAASILDISGEITPEIAKTAYREAALLYHPDRNPGGLEMMKIVNAAYDALKEFSGNIDLADTEPSYGPELSDALNAIIDLEGLEIEICGSWIWVSGNTYEHKGALKAAGFRFAGKKKMWHFRPVGWKSSSRGSTSMDDIRDTYGSHRPQREERAAIT